MQATLFSKFTSLTDSEVFDHLHTSQSGLSSTSANSLLAQVGENELKSAKFSALPILLRQFRSSFIYLLIAAAIIAGFLGERTDSLMIIAFIILDTSLGFFQEYRSEKTVALLRKYTIATSNVRRDNLIIKVPSTQLVPGDLLLIEPGAILPADIRFISTTDLLIDESILTGESTPTPKSALALTSPHIDIFNAANIGFAGTTVLRGSGEAVIFGTGANSNLGSISKSATQTRRISVFETGISGYSKFILRLVLVTLAMVFLANLIIKGPSASISELIIFSIALAVSVIPEALPVVITFSLSRGAHRLASHKVVVKRLSAIEDLGSIEILCTDKTGTLTENHLTVAEIHSSDPIQTVAYSLLVSLSGNDPFDLALRSYAETIKLSDFSTYSETVSIPFDPLRKRITSLLKTKNKFLLISRGAPESLLPLCRLSHTQTAALNSWVATEGKLGRRVLCIASKTLPKKPLDLANSESSLIFMGLISFVDPIKSSTHEAINHAKSLGLSIKVITGDNPQVAGAVATSIKLISDPSEVLTGDDFSRLSLPEQLAAVEKYHVFARITPDQKFHIIELLQHHHAVGFLGEGINDAPALKIANVALVVQSASDVARENADIILLQKNLSVIVSGIREGREVFVNTTKYLKSTLASNFGNFYAVAISSLFISFLPMLPVQILLLNLLSDFPMIAVATDNVDPSETRLPQIYDIKKIILLATTLGLVSTLFDFIFFGLYFRHPASVLQTNWFIGSILTELVFIFSIRSSGFFLKSRRPSTPLLSLSVCAAILTLLLPYLNFTQKIFKFTPPSLSHLITILSLVVIYFCTTETIKLFYFKFLTTSKNTA